MRLPDWLKNRCAAGKRVHGIKRTLRGNRLHTVCEEARCPNLGECFERGTATFLILGNVCTRRCTFCAINGGSPTPVDPDEPRRVALQAKEMKLTHVVITSVTRDDLTDSGASQFVQTIEQLNAILPSATVEVLIPDFGGSFDALKAVCDAHPDVLNHNVETVERLTPIVRDKATYGRSLELLTKARDLLADGSIKSGLMVGLGETPDEVQQTLRDLYQAGVDTVTIGQYLRPSRRAQRVAAYIRPEMFDQWKAWGERIGFRRIVAGPLVRSSYRAGC